MQQLILLQINLALGFRTRFYAATAFRNGLFRAVKAVPGLTSIHDVYFDLQALLRFYYSEHSEGVGTGVEFGHCSL